MIALPGTDAQEAAEVVARIRGRAAEVETSTGQALTVSAGIVGFPEHATDQARLMHLADGAMYWSKSHGKDRAFIYSQAIDFALSPAEAAERNLRAGLVNTVHALARAVDAKDGYTHSHSQRVARYAGVLAVELGIDGEQLEMIRTAGVLHDVGKIGISDAVLLKPGPLDAGEFDDMKRHSELGRDIIAGAGMVEIATWVLHLHERFDGGGYPGGLQRRGDPVREPRAARRGRARGDDVLARLPRRASDRDRALRAEVRRRHAVRPGRRQGARSGSCARATSWSGQTRSSSARPCGEVSSETCVRRESSRSAPESTSRQAPASSPGSLQRRALRGAAHRHDDEHLALAARERAHLRPGVDRRVGARRTPPGAARAAPARAGSGAA